MILEACLGCACANGALAPPSSQARHAIGGAGEGREELTAGGEQPMLMLLLQPAGEGKLPLPVPVTALRALPCCHF